MQPERCDKVKEAQEAIEKARADKLDRLKDIANSLFSTPDGMEFVKEVQRLCKINVVDAELDLAKMAHEKGMRTVYMCCFKNLIKPETMAKIERL